MQVHPATFPRFGAFVISFLLTAAACAGAPPAFRVWFDESVRAEPADGRLVVFLIRDGARIRRGADPADAPFYNDPQPIYGVDVAPLAPGEKLGVGRDVAGFPVSVDELPAGSYRARAVLDVVRADSDWSREAGNLYSDVASFTKADGETFTVDLPLTRVVEASPPPRTPGVEWFESRSALLSEFRGREATHRAGVILPEEYDPAKRYAAIYIVPGFGGDHRYALPIAASGPLFPPGGAARRHAFIIVLNPESENGHTLFADSANNGPCGRALVEEFIPALEATYPLIREPGARIVVGHSSGGWASIWLAMNYPETFGWCFSGSPDPVDFHAFQKVNIYEQSNFYTDAEGRELASNQKRGEVRMTIRQENLWEEVRGPSNTSGQQWDSWQAVFGPRDGHGRPAALFDPFTGEIDRAIADQYRRYDIVHLLTERPERFGPIFAERVRIVVGGEDEWGLHLAVGRLKDRLKALGIPMNGEAAFGRIAIVPGADHVSVTATDEYRDMGRQMLEALRRRGVVGP